ncbi:MAG: hypothetical protein IJG64_04035 [Oscillospiraceae bacterium]|nr:hypothetical protein [Oscillospiraceae bacterium]
MDFYVTERVFEKMPNVCFGLVSVKDRDNSKAYPYIDSMLDRCIASCEEHFEGKTVKQEKELAPYREAFTSMGINPNKFMSSIEALLTRIAKKKGMPHINPIVDLGNAISLKYYLPVGAHDLRTMDGEFCVRTANEEDTFLPFSAEEREKVDLDEVVYATSNRVRTRRWIWRQSEEGKILEDTSEVLFIIDGFAENKEEIMKAREELDRILREEMGCRTKVGFIDIDNKTFDMDI